MKQLHSGPPGERFSGLKLRYLLETFPSCYHGNGPGTKDHPSLQTVLTGRVTQSPLLILFSFFSFSFVVVAVECPVSNKLVALCERLHITSHQHIGGNSC